MRKLRLILIVLVTLALVGCQEQFQDLDTRFYSDPSEIRQEYPVLVTNPDSVTIYRNADGFPNAVILCIKGVPFSATSSQHQGGLRQVLALEGSGIDVTALCSDAPEIDEDDEPVEEPQ